MTATTKKLPPTQQAAIDRLKAEGDVRWAAARMSNRTSDGGRSAVLLTY